MTPEESGDSVMLRLRHIVILLITFNELHSIRITQIGPLGRAAGAEPTCRIAADSRARHLSRYPPFRTSSHEDLSVVTRVSL